MVGKKHPVPEEFCIKAFYELATTSSLSFQYLKFQIYQNTRSFLSIHSLLFLMPLQVFHFFPKSNKKLSVILQNSGQTSLFLSTFLRPWPSIYILHIPCTYFHHNSYPSALFLCFLNFLSPKTTHILRAGTV